MKNTFIRLVFSVDFVAAEIGHSGFSAQAEIKPRDLTMACT
jgi:hypothetical protein